MKNHKIWSGFFVNKSRVNPIFVVVVPRNLFLRKDNSICIGDLGSAKLIENPEASMTMVGTPRYMSPEQHHLGVYSFGTDIWYMQYSLFSVFIYMHWNEKIFKGLLDVLFMSYSSWKLRFRADKSAIQKYPNSIQTCFIHNFLKSNFFVLKIVYPPKIYALSNFDLRMLVDDPNERITTWKLFEDLVVKDQ